MSNPIDPTPPFRGPSALDLLEEFRKSYIRLVDARRLELRAIVDKSNGEYSPEAALAHQELDRLHYAEPELHRLIHTFTAEAVKPFQDVLTDIAMSAYGADNGTPMTVAKFAGGTRILASPPATNITATSPPAQRLPGDSDPLT